MGSSRGRTTLGVALAILAGACSLFVDANELSVGAGGPGTGPIDEPGADANGTEDRAAPGEDAAPEEDAPVVREAIVYRSDAVDGFQIWVMDTDGSNRKALTTDMGASEDHVRAGRRERRRG